MGGVGWGEARGGYRPHRLALRATQGYLGKDRRKRWRTGSWKGRHTLHLSLPQIGTCVPASRASAPICEPLRNNSATRPVPSRGRLQTAATKNSLLYGQWRAAAQGGPGAVFPAVKVTSAQPWASRQTGGGVTWHPRQVTQFPAPTTYTVLGQDRNNGPHAGLSSVLLSSSCRHNSQT